MSRRWSAIARRISSLRLMPAACAWVSSASTSASSSCTRTCLRATGDSLPYGFPYLPSELAVPTSGPYRSGPTRRGLPGKSVMHLMPETVSGPSARFRTRSRLSVGAGRGSSARARAPEGRRPRGGRGLASGHRGRSGFRRPGPGVVDDRREQHDLDGAAEDVVVPLADRPSDDREGIHDAQGDVGDPANPWSQDEREEHHQAWDDHVGGGPEEERLVDGEPTDFARLDIGPEVGPVEGEEVDVGEDEQNRRPQRRDLDPHVHVIRFELGSGGHG